MPQRDGPSKKRGIASPQAQDARGMEGQKPAPSMGGKFYSPASKENLRGDQNAHTNKDG